MQHSTITVEQFNHLPQHRRYLLLEQAGVYLEVYRLRGVYKIALFSFHSFYVEVWLNQATDRLLKAKAFDDYKALDPFLSRVNIVDLYARH